MLGVIPLWLHIFAAAVWVGSQVMMFAVVLPSLREVEEPAIRSRLMVEVTARLGWLGTAALVVLIATGIDNVDTYAPSRLFDLRYGFVLALKLALLAVVVGLTALNTLVLAPRLLDLQGQAASIHEVGIDLEARDLQQRSLLVTVAVFILSLAILFCAALLRSGWALHGV